MAVRHQRVPKLLVELQESLDAYRVAYRHARQSLELNGRAFTEYDARMYAAKQVRDAKMREPEVIRLDIYSEIGGMNGALSE